MDSRKLGRNDLMERFVREGFRGVSADQLPAMQIWCEEMCIESGEAGYCVAGETLRTVAEWWFEHDESGGIPTRLASAIERSLQSGLPTVFESDDIKTRVRNAVRLREETIGLLIPKSEWDAWR